MQDLMEKIKDLKIDDNLDLNIDDLMSILNSCNGSIIIALHLSFKAGFFQGQKRS